MTKKSDKKEVESKPGVEMTLSTFKDIQSIDNMEYASLKAQLKAKDSDKYPEPKLLTELERLRKSKAFK